MKEGDKIFGGTVKVVGQKEIDDSAVDGNLIIELSFSFLWSHLSTLEK